MYFALHCRLLLTSHLADSRRFVSLESILLRLFCLFWDGLSADAFALTPTLASLPLLLLCVFAPFDLWIVDVRRQIVSRVAVNDTINVVLFPDLVQMPVFLLYLYWVYWASVDELLGVSLLVFREVQIHITSNSMPICRVSCNTVFVNIFVNYLVFHPVLDAHTISCCWSLAGFRFSSKRSNFKSLSICHPLLLVLFCFGFHYFDFLFSIVFLKLPDFILMLFLELMVFFHYCVHIIVVDFLNQLLLSLFHGVVDHFQSKLLTHFLLKSFPIILFIQLRSFCKI